MNILVTAANGLLGPYIVEAFAAHKVSTTTREGCDLTNRASVKALLSGTNPDVVIHLAAETDVDYCESNPIEALNANRDTTYQIAELLPPTAKLAYISTDMVYPDIRGPHRECDVGPVNIYGRSKLGGEKAAQTNPRHLILRTNFFGPSRSPKRISFSDWVIRSLQDGSTPIFFNDAWFTPLHMKTLSAVILEAVERDVVGIYNVGSQRGMSKAEFAKSLAVHTGIYMKATFGPSYYRTKRPKDLTLDCTKLMALGFNLPTLEEEIKKL